jgi:hypothetical protein
MKKLLWFVTGISLGVIVANQLKENPKAQELASDLTRRAKDFGAAVAEGYREREAEIAAEQKTSNN